MFLYDLRGVPFNHWRLSLPGGGPRQALRQRLEQDPQPSGELHGVSRPRLQRDHEDVGGRGEEAQPEVDQEQTRVYKTDE